MSGLSPESLPGGARYQSNQDGYGDGSGPGGLPFNSDPPPSYGPGPTINNNIGPFVGDSIYNYGDYISGGNTINLPPMPGSQNYGDTWGGGYTPWQNGQGPEFSSPYGHGGPGWNPSFHNYLFPQIYENNTFIDIPGNGGYRGGDWNSTYYGGPEFDMRTELTQNLNQYFANNHYAGNTFNIAGNTNTTNLFSGDTYTNHLHSTNIDARVFNGDAITNGPSGRQGSRGLDGSPGIAGQDGENGIPGAQGPPGGMFWLPGNFGQTINQHIDNRVFNNNPGNQGGMDPVARRVAGLAYQGLRRLSLALKNLKLTPIPADTISDVTFDPDTCELTVVDGPDLVVLHNMGAIIPDLPATA
jgi:hypothetical protein